MVNNQYVYGCVAVDIHTGAFDSINFRLNQNTFASVVGFLGDRIFIGGELLDFPLAGNNSIMLAADTLNGDTIPGLSLRQHICNWTHAIIVDTTRIFLGGDFSNGMINTAGHHSHFIVYDAQQTLLSATNESRTSDSYFAPNPFSETSRILIRKTNAKNIRMNLYDIYGRNIKSQEINSPETVFERDGLPSGVYFYTLSDKANKISSGKIIIQ
jgi:hypothetical protein